jgi:hypothetical protein
VDLPAGRARACASQLRAAEGDPGIEKPRARYRKALIEERTREVQRLEKVLQDAGIKLSLLWPPGCWASRGGRCSMRLLAAQPIPRYLRSWLGEVTLEDPGS